jgi:hypothetical protein
LDHARHDEGSADREDREHADGDEQAVEQVARNLLCARQFRACAGARHPPCRRCPRQRCDKKETAGARTRQLTVDAAT